MRPGKKRMLYAPNRHRDIVQDTIDICGSRAQLAEVPSRTDLPAASQLQIESDPGDNVAVLIVSQAGHDLTSRIDAERSRMFAQGVDALYVDLPLDRPESAHVSDALVELNLSYSGVFPNNQAAGDVLRLQCLRDAATWCHDVAVASPHGPRSSSTSSRTWRRWASPWRGTRVMASLTTPSRWWRCGS